MFSKVFVDGELYPVLLLIFEFVFVLLILKEDVAVLSFDILSLNLSN